MLMGGEINDGETQKEFYNTISDETDRLSRLIENLLNISKMEMGSLSLNSGLVKTDWLVEDCMAAIEAAAQKKHITTEKNLPDKFPSLVGDKELLKVAVINILSNAVKYTPENGTITFSLNEQDNTIIFDVNDTGYGISQEDLSITSQRNHPFLNSSPSRIIQANKGNSDLHRHIHNLAYLGSIGFTQGTSKYGEILRKNKDFPTIDISISGNDSIAGDSSLLHSKIDAAVFDKRINFLKAPFIE